MNKTASMDQLFLEKVNVTIENNLANENFGVDELANEIGISRSHLHHKLTTYTGQSPSQIIKEFRLKKAFELLQANVANVSEVSYQVGFSSPSYFSTCFSEFFGYPPGKVKHIKSYGITKKYFISRKFIFISLATLMVVASVLILYNLLSKWNIETTEEGITYNSIAVLPFEDMSLQKDQEYFCDGIAEEIINALKHIDGLKVIARNSAFSFKGMHEDIREIGKKHNVETLLEGSVRKAGNRLRIFVQLVKVEDGSYLWSERYDRDMEDIFDIQDEISLAIAENLKVELLGEEKAAVVKRPTENPVAYDYYLQGNEYYHRGFEELDFNIAIQMYQKAIELDPDFALAYTRLAISHLFLYHFQYDRSENRLMRSKEAIDAAFKREPKITESYIARGIYYYLGFREYSKALKQFEKALNQSPNNPECIFWMACVHRRAGNWEKAKEYFSKAFKLDPRSSQKAANAGGTYHLLREYSEALHYYDIAIMLRPDYYESYYGKIQVYVNWKGNTQEARIILENANKMVTSSIQQAQLKLARYRLELLDGDYEEALKYLPTEKSEAIRGTFSIVPGYQNFAILYGLMNNPKLEYTYYDSSR